MTLNCLLNDFLIWTNWVNGAVCEINLFYFVSLLTMFKNATATACATIFTLFFYVAIFVVSVQGIPSHIVQLGSQEHIEMLKTIKRSVPVDQARKGVINQKKSVFSDKPIPFFSLVSLVQNN